MNDKGIFGKTYGEKILELAVQEAESERRWRTIKRLLFVASAIALIVIALKI